MSLTRILLLRLALACVRWSVATMRLAYVLYAAGDRLADHSERQMGRARRVAERTVTLR